jgi:hypothetical protein
MLTRRVVGRHGRLSPVVPQGADKKIRTLCSVLSRQHPLLHPQGVALTDRRRRPDGGLRLSASVCGEEMHQPRTHADTCRRAFSDSIAGAPGRPSESCRMGTRKSQVP